MKLTNRFFACAILIATTLGLSGCLTGAYSSSASTALSLSAADSTIGFSDVVAMTATGGTLPYTYSVTSGGGTIDASSGQYTSPAYASSVVIEVTDAEGATATATVSVASTNSNSSGLSISPNDETSFVGDTVGIYATGGTEPYTYAITSGVGQISGSSLIATQAGDVVIEATDSAGATDNMTVHVISADPLNLNAALSLDYYVGVAYDTHEQGLDTTNQAQLVVFGLGSTISNATLGGSISGCSMGSGIELSSPCVVRIPLTNFVAGSSVADVYQGTLEIVGRNATISMDFCIRQSDSDRMYVKWTKNANLSYQETAFNLPTRLMLAGRTVHAAYNSIDTSSGASTAAIHLTNAGFTSSSICGAGFTTTQYLQTSN